MERNANARRLPARDSALPAAATAAAVLLVLVPPARAQDAAPTAAVPLERIEITGSNIGRAESDTAENVTVISAAEIKRSGQPTVADFIRTISADFASFNETFVNSFAPGASGVALRGLSQKNTLVLLNGRRLANFGFAQNLEDTFVDLNSIPIIAVDRIEVLKSGAAAIYGSDATAGVVNIILKKDSTEGSADAGVSATSGGGGGTRDAALALGSGDLARDNYNVYVTGALFKRDDLTAAERPYTAGQDFRAAPGGFLAWLESGNYTNNSNTVNTAFPSCYGGQKLNMNQFPTTVTGTTCAYDPANQVSLIPGTERANLTATADYKLLPDWTLFGDIFFANVKTTARFTPTPFGPPSIAYDPATGGVRSVANVLPVGNPSNPYAAPTQINYVFNSVGGRDYDVISDSYRASGGIKGNWLAWSWEAAYGHSENHVTQTNYNSINVPALESAIQNGAFDFIDPTLTPAANNALRANWTYSSVSKLDTLDAKTTGTLLAVPAGTLDGAIGVEFRHESIVSIPSSLLAAGDILNYGLISVDGGRSVYAAFGELSVPIVKDLDLDLAAREEHYSDVGANFSPQGELNWHPLRQFSARAVVSKGFRAPSLPEISHASSTSFETVTDPLDPLGRPSELSGVVTQANPKLRPEISKNLDLGLVFSPVPNANLSLDYYRIAVDHVIATENTAQNIIEDPAAYPGQVFRTPSGILEYVVIPYENLYQILTSGVDVEGDAAVPVIASAKLRFKLGATYVQHMAVNNGSGWSEYAGSNGWLYLSPISGGGPAPRWRGHLGSGWETSTWLAQATVNYTSGYADSCYAAGYCGADDARVASDTTVDLYGEYSGVKSWTFSASIINLANRQPPFDWFAFVSSTYEPFDQTLYDARGRVYQLRAQYRF